MCPRRANECFVPGGTTGGDSNEELAKRAFAAGFSKALQGPNTSRIVTPIARLDSPRSRIWGSVSRSARSNTRRHAPGFRNGSSPSKISTSATALQSSRPTPPYFFLTAASPAPAPAAPLPEPRIALKKSEPVSTTTTSDFLLKLAR